MEPPILAAIAFSFSQLALAGLVLIGQRPWRVSERLFALLLLAIAAYLLTPFDLPEPLDWLSHAWMAAVPGMFWLFSASVFDDHFRLRRWQLGLVAVTVVLPPIGRELKDEGSALLDALLISAPQTLEFVLLALTLWAVVQHWRVDLVETRRGLRLWFVGLNGSYIFAVVFSQQLLFKGDTEFARWQFLPMALMLLLMNTLLLRYREAVLFAPAEVSRGEAHPEQPLEAPDTALVARLESLMEQQLAYREMGLTIGQLAERMEVPQYRLRQTINRGMGYRNFSDFLNRYRIAEAARRLRDPAQESLPVLTIAMDAGFRSLSSFNKAFKEAHGITPTAWRKSNKN